MKLWTEIMVKELNYVVLEKSEFQCPAKLKFVVLFCIRLSGNKAIDKTHFPKYPVGFHFLRTKIVKNEHQNWEKLH